jgi:hypothetical protein
MSLSTCDYCGGHISLGPCELNRCESCGPGVFERDPLPEVKMLADSELVALRAEVVKLRAENEMLKKIERQRWGNVNRTLGTNYPKQMNEGESAKWTAGNRSAAHWGQEGGE